MQKSGVKEKAAEDESVTLTCCAVEHSERSEFTQCTKKKKKKKIKKKKKRMQPE